MQMIAFGWMLLFAFSPTVGTAADVNYQLDVKSLSVSDSPRFDEVTRIEFEERVWWVPGIEQATEPLPSVQKFDFAGPRRIRLVGNGLPSDGPYWLDDVAWPRTRQSFHPSSCRVFYFGGIALQR